LSVVTVVEVIIAIVYEKYLIPMGWSHGLLRLFLVVMSLLKAGYIMAVFMHVKHERKSLIFTILIPFTLLIWMIISFLMEGESWNNYNKNRFGQKPDPTILKQHGGVTHEHH
jgi:cytochrome c oxidase subunit IV